MTTLILFLLLKPNFHEPYALTLTHISPEMEAACQMDENCMDLNDFEVKNDK